MNFDFDEHNRARIWARLRIRHGSGWTLTKKPTSELSQTHAPVLHLCHKQTQIFFNLSQHAATVPFCHPFFFITSSAADKYWLLVRLALSPVDPYSGWPLVRLALSPVLTIMNWPLFNWPLVRLASIPDWQNGLAFVPLALVPLALSPENRLALIPLALSQSLPLKDESSSIWYIMMY
jgi:hypothetical protein